MADITEHIDEIEDILTDSSLTDDLKTQLETAKTLLSDLKTTFGELLQEIEKSRMKRATGKTVQIYFDINVFSYQIV